MKIDKNLPRRAEHKFWELTINSRILREYSTEQDALNSEAVLWQREPSEMSISLNTIDAIRERLLAEIENMNAKGVKGTQPNTVSYRPKQKYVLEIPDATILGQMPHENKTGAILYLTDRGKIAGPFRKPTNEGNQAALLNYSRILSKELIRDKVRRVNRTEKTSFQGRESVTNGISLLYPHRNYSHFLLESMTKIKRARECYATLGVKPKLLIRSDITDWQAEILETFPEYPSEFKSIDSFPCYVDRLLMTDFINFGSDYFNIHSNDVRWIGETIVNETTKSGEYPDRIFLSRQNVHRRKIGNFSEISKILSNYGFHEYAPEKLPINEQINLFNGAKTITGVIGSGYVNMIFGRNIQCFPIYPADWFPPVFYVLSQVFEHDWCPLVASLVKGDGHGKSSDVYVDPEKFRSHLEKNLGGRAEGFS